MKKKCILWGVMAAAILTTLPVSAQTAQGGRVLTAYFTMPETDGADTVSGASRVVKNGVVLGNTQFIAQCIQRAAGGDLFAIETVQRYPGTHAPLLDFAAGEKCKNARPQLRTHISNLNQYDGSLSATQTGTPICRPRSVPFLRNTTLAVKRSYRFPPTAEAGFQTLYHCAFAAPRNRHHRWIYRFKKHRR